MDSRDIIALQPTEPNMSITSFNTDGQHTGVISTAPEAIGQTPDYPLQNIITTRSNQEDDARLPSNQQLFPHTFFGMEESRMSQNNINNGPPSHR